MAHVLGLETVGNTPVQPRTLEITLHVPLLPSTYRCPVCPEFRALKRTVAGHVNQAWVIEPSVAYRVPVLLGECPSCGTVVYPDHFVRLDEHDNEQDVFDKEATVISIGRGRYASRNLGANLGTYITHSHLPLSTFAACWNASGVFLDEKGDRLKLNHKHMWRLFIVHHCLQFLHAGEVFSIPGTMDIPDEGDDDLQAEESDHDKIMVKMALALWPSVASGHYRTYHIRDSRQHHCAECAHHHRKFAAGEPVGGVDCTENALFVAHGHVQKDRTRLVTAAVIDGIEKIGHKVRVPSESNNYR